jgi:flagellar basal body-associated protein FliL
MSLLEVETLLGVITACGIIITIAGTAFAVFWLFNRACELLADNQEAPQAPPAAPQQLWTSIEYREPCQCKKPARKAEKGSDGKVDKSV